ncbi:hypothetical protein GCM10007377_00890 [Galliscardovia ingluviei]|uniref:Uncharacterized protein n=1 Tax=Galliscardovia ingluviei TaxID=1769422 RepID=A0A8J3EX42_9BIFI|nr:hypothetical protein GCM10007377_00890 [Galliscardovia ingluviei]
MMFCIILLGVISLNKRNITILVFSCALILVTLCLLAIVVISNKLILNIDMVAFFLNGVTTAICWSVGKMSVIAVLPIVLASILMATVALVIQTEKKSKITKDRM